MQPPLCECGAPASLHGGVWWLCNAPNGPSYRCNFARRAEFDAAHAAERIDGAVLEAYGALGTAALLTAAAFGPMGPWCFVSPSDDDLGLFARVDLVVGQAIGEYGGPRLPAHHHRCGRCVLLIPGTSTIIDAACENSPYDDVPRYPATFVMHSRWPNARLETWADAPGGGAPTELRERMWLVALEPIPAGGEIRIDYEAGSRAAGEEGTYWGHASIEAEPQDTNWRAVRLAAPPPTAAERVVDRLAALNAAHHAGVPPPPAPTPTPTGRATSRRSRGAATTAATSGCARSCRCSSRRTRTTGR